MFFTFAFPVILVLGLRNDLHQAGASRLRPPVQDLSRKRGVGQTGRCPHDGSDVQDHAGSCQRGRQAIRQEHKQNWYS